ILKGAVPDRTRGSGHTAPTYLCRFPGSAVPRPGRHLFSRPRRFCPGLQIDPDRRDLLADTASDIEALKDSLRQRAREQRAEIPAADRPDAAQAAAQHFLDEIEIPDGATIGAYWPIRDEIDC